MRLLVSGCAIAAVVVSGGCDLRTAFSAHVDAVARAGDHELKVERLAEIVANGRVVPLRRDVVERLAGLWVDYTLLADRLASGDSLLDSLTVVHTLWSESQMQIVTHYHEELVDNRVSVSEAAVDSAFQAGDHRLIHHVLVRTEPTMSGPDRDAKRQMAERLRRMALTGPDGWARANRENEDSTSRLVNGSVGVIGRGQTVPEFEQAAFELDAGSVSPVVESAYGFHIIWRPPLSEVRDRFRQGVRSIFVERMNFQFIGELEARWRVSVKSGAPQLMREASADPPRARASRKVLGTYAGGDFTVGDFVRWLRALPPEYTAQVASAGDEELQQFVRGLIRNDVLEVEARNAGHELTEEDYAFLRETMAQNLEQLREAMVLDPSRLGARPAEERSSRVDSIVDKYLGAVTNDLAQLVIIPPFLAEKLRLEADWEVSSSGVNRALDRATTLRSLVEAAGLATSESGSDSSSAKEKGQ